jgi:transcriptional regulator with XRE-family HTH domain
MAKVNGSRWRLYRTALRLTSNAAAELLGISGGALRQIELDTKPASDELVLRAARLYQCELIDLLATEDPVTEPPSKKQEKEKGTGPGRDGGAGTGTGGKSGPKRARAAA